MACSKALSWTSIKDPGCSPAPRVEYTAGSGCKVGAPTQECLQALHHGLVRPREDPTAEHSSGFKLQAAPSSHSYPLSFPSFGAVIPWGQNGIPLVIMSSTRLPAADCILIIKFRHVRWAHQLSCPSAA